MSGASARTLGLVVPMVTAREREKVGAGNRVGVDERARDGHVERC